MKTDVTYIPTANLVAILDARNISYVKQSGFYRVNGPTGRRLYVAATKNCGRIDISGFTVEFGAKPHFLGKFGRVEQMLDMSLPAEDVIKNFETILDFMMALPPVEKVPRAPKAKKEKSEGVAPTKTTETPDAKARRLELIRKVAEQKGMKVSPKTEAELA